MSQAATARGGTPPTHSDVLRPRGLDTALWVYFGWPQTHENDAQRRLWPHGVLLDSGDRNAQGERHPFGAVHQSGEVSCMF